MAGHDHIEKLVCRGCYAVLDAGDNFCRYCGAPAGSASRRPPARGDAGLPVQAELVAPPAAARGWSESPWAVLLLLFCVLGPLALPMLWRSRRFSRFWKLVLTAIVVGLTALVLGLIWYVFDKLVEPLRDLHRLQRL
jgi:hypothetical protein